MRRGILFLGMVECFVGLGGNLEGSLETMRECVQKIGRFEGVENVFVSRLFLTTPVSDIPQPSFFNAACRFDCRLPLLELWNCLEVLEIQLGKEVKPKNAPRLIDIDLLFFGEVCFRSESLIVPHPCWQDRLFVLAPLAELTGCSFWKSRVQEKLQNFTNPYKEQVIPCGTLT